MSIRIAHITDIHWMVSPRLEDVWRSKRLLGTANLYIGRRRHDFSESVQTEMVEHVLRLAPDAVIITGDLTAQALPAEFEKARAALDPILRAMRTFIIPGNHDLYTAGAARSKRIEKHFLPWMGLERHAPLGRLDFGRVTILGLDPNRPSPFHSSGRVPAPQLAKLREILDDPDLASRFVILAIHYPLVWPSGRLYDSLTHGLRNASELIDLLARSRTRPRLVLHGHKHHGFPSRIPLGDGSEIEGFNPGCGGFVYNPSSRRTAAVNLYTIADDDGVSLVRHLHTGERFEPEAPTAYASGF